MKKIIFFLVLLTIISSAYLEASEVDDAESLIYSGQLEKGANKLASFIKKHPRDKNNTPKALNLLGNTLDQLQDLFSERAEMACYWRNQGGQSLSCMQKHADKLNSIYGKDAFKAITDVAYIPYSGLHYETLIKRFPGSEYASDARFWLLLKNLVGHPDIVLPRIKSYMKKYQQGKDHRRALLLWARVNEDVWYVHRDYSWVLYNEKVAIDELIIRAEPYRQEALSTYKQLLKYKDTFEGQAAKNEYNLLKANKGDGKIYSILDDSIGGTPDSWGSKVPNPRLKAGKPVYKIPETVTKEEPKVEKAKKQKKEKVKKKKEVKKQKIKEKETIKKKNKKEKAKDKQEEKKKIKKGNKYGPPQRWD